MLREGTHHVQIAEHRSVYEQASSQCRYVELFILEKWILPYRTRRIRLRSTSGSCSSTCLARGAARGFQRAGLSQ